MPAVTRIRKRAPAPAGDRQPAQDNAAETCTLVLQGGGALGAYQAGVYEQMAAHGLQPQWVAGVSIGAINAAIIAGNPPGRRIDRLHEFWDLVTSRFALVEMPRLFGKEARELLNQSRATMVAALGVPGFFEPRIPPAVLQWPGMRGAVSYYDTAPLQDTLERLVDFDLINTTDPKYKVRLSVGAVDVTTGNYRYFDSGKPERCGRIDARHIMASGALPPGFPPVEIDGRSYWDGGLVSNTPLAYVLDQPAREDMLVLQVDLFPTRGALPRNISEVAARHKDIQYASRTRLNTDRVTHLHELGAAARRLADKLPASFRDDPDLAVLTGQCAEGALTIVHMIYRSRGYETQSKDYEFSRQSMLEHWHRGAADVQTSLADPRWHTRRRAPGSITVLDLTPQRGVHEAEKETA